MLADILEIFSSIQGEGIYAGERQIFIRFADCNLDCIYCDVDKNKKVLQFTIDDILSKVKMLNKHIEHKTISITGGEPLIYWEFLNILLHKLKKDFKIYLETNGTLANELKNIIRLVDIIAADIKLPSVAGQGHLWKEHLQFLKIARAKEVFVKIIVSSKLAMQDFKKAISLVRKINSKIPVVIQPVQSMGSDTYSQCLTPSLLNLQKYALRYLDNVYVIPQVHKIIGAR